MSNKKTLGLKALLVMAVALCAALFAFACTKPEPKDDLTLSSVKAGAQAMTFDGTDTYTLSDAMANTVTSVTFTIVTTDSAAYVAMEGGLTNRALSVGENTFTFKVTGPNQEKTYKIKITRLPSDDLTLSALSVNGKAVSLSSMGTENDPYVIYVGDASVTAAVATPANADATSEIKSAGAAVTFPIDLVYETAKEFTVSVSNGVDSATYYLNAVRADTRLTAITVDGENATLETDGTYSYSVDKSKVTVIGVPNNSNAVVTIISGNPNALANGVNEFKLNTIRSGVSQQYTLKITCDVPDTSLSTLSVAGQSIDIDSASVENGVYFYRVFVPSGLVKFPVSVEKANSGAAFVTNPTGTAQLTNGKYTAEFSVKKESSATGNDISTDYKLIVTESKDDMSNVIGEKQVLFVDENGNTVDCASVWGHKMSNITDVKADGSPNTDSTSTAAVVGLQPSSIYVDLLQVFSINKVRVMYAACATEYTIKVSVDGGTWTTVKTVEDLNPKKWVYIEDGFDAVEARYVRIDVTDMEVSDPSYDGKGAGYNIADMQIIGKIPNGDIAALIPTIELNGTTFENAGGNVLLFKTYDPSVETLTINVSTATGYTAVIKKGAETIANNTATSLALGEQNYVIEISNEAGTYTRCYELTVMRGSDSTDIDTLTVNDIAANYNETSGQYEVAISSSKAVIVIVPSDNGAYTLLTGNADDLFDGENEFTFKVTAQNTIDTKEYKLIITANIEEVMLESLSINGDTVTVGGSELSYSFAGGVTEAAYIIAAKGANATVSFKLGGEGAAITGKTGNLPCAKASQFYILTVTSEDGSYSKEYKLTLSDVSLKLRDNSAGGAIGIKAYFYSGGTLEVPTGAAAQTNYGWGGLENVLDGNTGTTSVMLADGAIPAEGYFAGYVFDYGASIKISKIHVYFASYYSREFAVQYSADGENWTTLQTFTDFGQATFDAGVWQNTAVTVTDEFSARYIRLTAKLGTGYSVVDDAAWRGISLAELQVTARD